MPISDFTNCNANHCPYSILHNAPSSKHNTSSSAGKEKRLGESRLCGVSGTGEDASGMSVSTVGWTWKPVSVSTVGWTRKPVSVSTVGCKRGEAGGGCGGGSGEATMDAGVKSDEAVTNFCPGRRAPSLQDCLLVLVTLWSPDLSTRENRDKEVTTLLDLCTLTGVLSVHTLCNTYILIIFTHHSNYRYKSTHCGN